MAIAFALPNGKAMPNGGRKYRHHWAARPHLAEMFPLSL